MHPVEYLTEKVRKVIPDSERLYNEGARIIASYPDWEEYIDDLVYTAWDTLLKYSIKNKAVNYKATAKLTFISTSIGLTISQHLEMEEPTIKEYLGLGDLFLESFLQQGLIEITREFQGVKAPYVVRVINDKDLTKPL